MKKVQRMKRLLFFLVMAYGSACSAMWNDGPLHHAVRAGDREAVQRLLSERVAIDAPGFYKHTALHTAARYGHKDIVNMLVAAGANVHAEDCAGLTPIYTAVCCAHLNNVSLVPATVCRQHWSVVEKLLDSGVDINVRNGSLLYAAVANRCFFTMRNLLARGINSNGRDDREDGVTALQEAVAWRRPGVISLLVDYGANPNIQTMRGYTALHAAVEHNCLDMCKELIAAGANPFIKNDAGETACEFALMAYSQNRGEYATATKAILDYLRTLSQPITGSQPAACVARVLDHDDTKQQ